MNQNQIIPSLNFHLYEPCNMRCGFCFATFQDVKHSVLPKGHLPKTEAIELMHLLGQSGLFEKINFAGGEPMLCPWLGELIKIAKSYGLTTSIVTNGTKITDAWLAEMKLYLDWIGISIDSLSDETNLLSGRSIVGKKVLTSAEYQSICLKIKAFAYKLKINTVVHRLNWQEDFSDFIRAVEPERWKVFQVLPIEGQNDAKVDKFLISEAEFQAFIQKHKHLACVVSESNEAIKGSYLMIDPAGRFFDNSEGKHRYSQAILQVGVKTALAEINNDFEKFVQRGGQYDW
ncbi:MAG: viperin family antiviral radical SAM protein [Microscillaceae bacterium]|jgi:radical S-adenosyl methionine domain-containing protein 2|nr:viperin family antiviral radical SAM protein [Microscillaceae bacterium]